MATAAHLEQHRAQLMGHCYRMLGSSVEADDAVQETMVRAWKALSGFDGRASLKTWLYRIATNVCLDALADRKRRHVPFDERPAGSLDGELTQLPSNHWLEPVPDHRVVPTDCDPAEALVLRQSIRLAFVAALQHLPPKQRATLLLMEVLGWTAAETADCLATTVPAVNSALQRARATLTLRNADAFAAELSEAQVELVARYADAFERYDIDTLVTLLHEDVALCMPPYELWLCGRATIHAWMLRHDGCRGSVLVPVRANGMPAFAQYRPSDAGPRAWSIVALELNGDRITRVHNFLDAETLFPLFGLSLDRAA